MKYAITGGIGCGKSYVCKVLKSEYGIEVYDCDAAAKRLIRTSGEIKRQLTELIGEGTYTEQGELNKARVSEYLLQSPQNQQSINAIVHPAVAEDFKASGCEWMECAILFESGFDRLVDRVVCVTAPKEVRLSRIMQRDGISRERAQQWIDCQMDAAEVAQRSDIVIVNDGVNTLDKEIDRIINN